MGSIWWIVGTCRAPVSAVCFSKGLKFTVGGVGESPELLWRSGRAACSLGSLWALGCKGY